MPSPNEIAGLQQIAVKPKIWRITETLDGFYNLEFSWFDQDKTEFTPVQTQRSGMKIYRSIKTLMHDIAKVDHKAVIHLDLAQPW